MLQKKSIFSIILLIIFFFCYFPLSVLASNNTEFEYYLHAISNSTKKYDNITSYESDKATVAEHQIDYVKILSTTTAFSIFLPISDSGLEACFYGNIYSINGDGYYDDKLILGNFDFSLDNNYNIVLFKILKEDTDIAKFSLLIENIDTGELIESSFSVDNNKFTVLMNIAKENTSVLENQSDDQDFSTAKELLSLLQPQKRCISAVNSSTQSTTYAQSNYNFTSTTGYGAQVGNFSLMQQFFTEIYDDSDSSITPSSHMQQILSQTGWGIYRGTNFFYVIHGVQNTNTEQLVGLTLVSFSHQRPNNGEEISASYTIVDACTVSYNKTTKTANLLFYNNGIRLEKAAIAIQLVGGTTNFYKATKTYSSEHSGKLKNVLIAISSKLSVANSIWEALTTTNETSDTNDFGTDSNQRAVYGDLVRAVGNQLKSSYYLQKSSSSIGVIGSFYTNKTFSTYKVSYSFTGYSLL